MPASSSESITNPNMNPENKAWQELCDRADARLPGDFAERVLRASRQRPDRSPSLFGQLALSAATAALCFLAIASYHSHDTSAQDLNSLADWNQVASAVDDSSLAQ